MSQTMSPFRYPGGKSQLYNFVDNLFTINKINGTYIEPFAGGSGLAIKLLIKGRVNNIWINDYDKSIYAVWYIILNSPQSLINRINDVPFDYKDGSENSDEFNLEYWKKIKNNIIHLKNLLHP
jgi:Site-specific DNA methylase